MKTKRFLFFLSLLISTFLICGKSIATEQAGQSFTLPTKKIMTDVAGRAETYPTYTTQLINLANQNSQATRPKKVGQMSELIQTFPGRSYDEWVKWYINKFPKAIDQATDDTYAMIQKMRHAMADIDRNMVRTWIRELILTKTFAGLRFQESILKEIAQKKKTSYRLAIPDEEAKGIDGYIGAKPVSIKPTSYKAKPFLPEDIQIEIIYYEKVRGGIKVFYK
jgi:MjaI-like restriction endonuclease